MMLDIQFPISLPMTHTKVRHFLHAHREIPQDIAAHLENCSECQAYAATIDFLSSELPAVWPEIVSSASSTNGLVHRVQAVIRERRPRQRVVRLGQEIGWVGLAVLFGLAMAWISGLIEPETILPLAAEEQSSPVLPLAGFPTPIPIPPPHLVTEEIILAEADLNCDGRVERLIGVVDRGAGNTYGQILSITLEVQDGGTSRIVWEMKTYLLPYFSFPRLILPAQDSCEQLVALPVKSSQNLFGDLLIFRWNGSTMETVLDAPGLPALDPMPPGRMTTVQRFAGDEADGKCTWTLTTYEWNGERFEQLSQHEQAVPCEGFLRSQPTGEIFQAVGEIGGRFTHILVQNDLNCDGRFERLLVERSVQSVYESGSPRIYRLRLETEGETMWELQPEQLGGYFLVPEVFSTGGCERLVAIIAHPALQSDGKLQVYRWDGQAMNLIVDSPGLPPTPKSLVSNLVQNPGQPFTLTTVETGMVVVEPGWCENIVYTYQWDENSFIQTGKVPVRVKCGG